MTKLRGHAYFLELAGRRGGPSPMWLVLLALGLVLAGLLGARPHERRAPPAVAGSVP